jgi:hypothetical protein
LSRPGPWVMLFPIQATFIWDWEKEKPALMRITNNPKNDFFIAVNDWFVWFLK